MRAQRGHRLTIRCADRRPLRHFLIETGGQRCGHTVIHILRRGDHHLDVGGQQVVDLRLCAAGVEKDKLQTALLGQEGGKAAPVDALAVAGPGLQEQVITLGVAAIVKDGDAPAQFWLLKGVQNIIERDVVEQLKVA